MNDAELIDSTTHYRRLRPEPWSPVPMTASLADASQKRKGFPPSLKC